MAMDYLVVSYPNFVLGQIIDPEEANQNNTDITSKVNEVVDGVNINYSAIANHKISTDHNTLYYTKTEIDSNLLVFSTNENTRVQNELLRVQQEAHRQLTYTDFNVAETTRINNEIIRQATYSEFNDDELIRIDNEVARLASEDARLASEEIRLNSEALRVLAEENRVLQEALRIAALNVTTANVNYYIDAVLGNDANLGTSAGAGGAFKTIGKALSLIPQIVNHSINIWVAAGDYSSELFITVKGKIGSGIISFWGDDNAIYKYISLSNNSITIVFDSGRLSGITGAIIEVANCKKVALRYLNFIGASGIGHGIVCDNSTVYSYACAISNRLGNAIWCSYGLVISDNNGGTSNNVCLSAGSGGTIVKIGTQPTGTTAESVYYGGQIRA